MFRVSFILTVAALFASILMADKSIADEPASTQTRAAQLLASDDVLIIAHRGDSGAAPENTLPAFQGALAARADMVELDYYHSKDGAPICFHDKTLDRTTNSQTVLGASKLSIEKTMQSDLAKLDAGAWFDVKFKGAKIPTLDEALDTIQAGSMTLAERKGGDGKTTIELLTKKKLIGDVMVQAFDWAFLRDCRQLSATVQLGALGSGKLDAARIEEIQNAGANFIGWAAKDLSAKNIAAAHAAGFKVFAWTVNDQPTANRLLAEKIDGIITDHPAKMRTWVDAVKK